ncbi:MAG: BON domain-containing protein, partial [Gemmatimonadaceae bacterium]
TGGRNADMGADSWGGGSDRDTGRDRYSTRDNNRDEESRDAQADRYRGREGGSNQFSSWQNNPSDTRGQSAVQRNQSTGKHAGRGPKGYRRDDARITEDVNEILTHDAHIDATDIEVSVSNGEVTLSGTVDSRDAKRHAEDLAERVSGVSDINNQIRVSNSRSSAPDAATGAT